MASANKITNWSFHLTKVKCSLVVENNHLDALLKRMVPYILEGIKLGDLKSLCSKPATLAYGMKDRAIDPDYAIRDFKALFPNSNVIEMPNAGHYSQEDEPETLIKIIKEFMLVYDDIK